MLRVSRSCAIALGELEWRFSCFGRSRWPARRTRRTRGSSCCFDIESSPSLGPRQRARLLETARSPACASSRRSDDRSCRTGSSRSSGCGSGSPPRCMSSRRGSPRGRRARLEAGSGRAEAQGRRAQADPAGAARGRGVAPDDGGRSTSRWSWSVLLAVVVVLDAVLRTFVLPRGATVAFTSLTFRSVRAAAPDLRPPSRGLRSAATA